MKKVINTNGVDRTQAAFQYLTGQGVAAWDSSTSYVRGDMAATSGNFLWRCIADNTNKPPTSNASFWISADPAGARDVIIRDAFFFGPPVAYPQTGITTPYVNFGAYPLVDGDQPISYGGTGTPITFVPFAIEKDKLSYNTGFEASEISLTMRPRDNPELYGAVMPFGMTRGDGTSLSEDVQVPPPFADPYAVVSSSPGSSSGDLLLSSLKQSFAQTDWYLAPVTILRFFIPSPQQSPGPLDVTSYGAAVMFRGRVSQFIVDKEQVKVDVASLMEIFKQKVPTQTVQPGNRWAPFDFTFNPDFVGATTPAVGKYNWVQLYFSPNPTPADGELNEGWALVDVSGVGLWWRRVYKNVNTVANTSVIYFLDPLPLDLTGRDVQCKLWKSSDTGTNPSGPGSGFPYVPQPLTGIS